jgi:cytochrome c biogenesis protein CcdA
VFDIVAGALRASSSHTIWAFPVVLSAGACSSIGPCVAPRFIAVASFAAGRQRRAGAIAVVAFVAGLVVAYACFGAIGTLVGQTLRFSTFIYGVLATALALSGARLLWHEEAERCVHGKGGRNSAGTGAVFLLGASFALVVSPCCTPLVLGIIAYSSAMGDPLYGSALLATFALGHALPVLFVGAGAQRIAALLSNANLKHAASTAAATLMLALAAYYVVLA